MLCVCVCVCVCACACAYAVSNIVSEEQSLTHLNHPGSTHFSTPTAPLATPVHPPPPPPPTHPSPSPHSPLTPSLTPSLTSLLPHYSLPHRHLVGEEASTLPGLLHGEGNVPNGRRNSSQIERNHHSFLPCRVAWSVDACVYNYTCTRIVYII